ncbi:MAG: hypothetical protein ACOX0V_11030 [Bacteroidales bacterium]|jgi:hypothetical protein
MKKLILLFLGVFVISVFYSQAQSDDDNYEFYYVRQVGSDYLLYFNVLGLENDIIAEKITSDLNADSNISEAEIFELKTGEKRIKILCEQELDANYIRNILVTYGADYDPYTVLINGDIKFKEKQFVEINNFSSQFQNVKYSDFPVHKNTGNKEFDDIEYFKAKEKWINENPEKYNELLNEMEKNHKTH